MTDPDTPMTDGQRKAFHILMSGMPFVMIGANPTAGGADFWTAIHGDSPDLRQAAGHMQGVIKRAFDRSLEGT